MRYDDILHRTLISSINGILSNPSNLAIKIDDVVFQAWKIAVATANYASANSILVPQTYTSTAPADASVTKPTGDDKINKPSSSLVTTDKPTSVMSPDGSFVSKR